MLCGMSTSGLGTDWLSAVELGRKIAAREISSREVTAHYLSRIEQVETRVSAFISRMEDALTAAERIDEQIATGKISSPLAGVPIAIKDVMCLEESPTTCGSRMLQEFRPLAGQGDPGS